MYYYLVQLMGEHFSHTAVPLSEQDTEMRSPDIHIILFRISRECKNATSGL